MPSITPSITNLQQNSNNSGLFDRENIILATIGIILIILILICITETFEQQRYPFHSI